MEFELPVPEFQLSKDDPIPIFIVKRASLDDQIRARELSSRPIRALTKILAAVRDGKELNEESIHKFLISDDGPHDKTYLEIILFSKCVIKPQFSIKEAHKLSERVPDLINRACVLALNGELEG